MVNWIYINPVSAFTCVVSIPNSVAPIRTEVAPYCQFSYTISIYSFKHYSGYPYKING